jgi:cell cycle arrest protein BUB2
MNVLLAPFLFVMPTELDAFACCSALLAKHCPRYVLANLEGVHEGCALADACLRALDPALHSHLQQRVQLQTKIFVFQHIFTLFANMSQLNQVLKVWDALFAFGVHFNCVLGA